jgi:hypothetical protein
MRVLRRVARHDLDIPRRKPFTLLAGFVKGLF